MLFSVFSFHSSAAAALWVSLESVSSQGRAPLSRHFPVLLPAWESQHRKELELLGRVLRRQQDDQRNGTALLGRKAGRVGIVCLERRSSEVTPL